MTARRYRLLVFDWDGTLCDSAALIAHAIQQACVDLGQPCPSAQTARYVIGLGIHEAARLFAPGLAEADYGRLAERYRHHFVPGDEAVTLFDGIDALLGELDARGFLLGVATGKSRRGLDRALERSGLARRFHATRCADEGFPKPHPAMLLHLMERLGVEPAETLMIGDTTHDLALARNAGVDGVAVTYGAHSEAALAEESPLVSAPTVGALSGWLLSLARPR